MDGSPRSIESDRTIETGSIGEENPIAFAGRTVVTADLVALGPPGGNVQRKLELLETCRAYLVAARRPVPDWWYELKRRVEAGEI